MISIAWDEKGIHSLDKRIDTLINNITKNTSIGLEEALKNIQATALKLKKGSKNEKLIPFIILKDDGKTIIGRVYTDKTVFYYAPFLEFGTGKLLDSTGPGPMPIHTKTYELTEGTYWWIPPELSPTGEWYLAKTQEAHPFMRPTAFQTRSETVTIIKEQLKRGIKEVILK